ncbi:hypothetical protein [Mucilaginibacter sp.]
MLAVSAAICEKGLFEFVVTTGFVVVVVVVTVCEDIVGSIAFLAQEADNKLIPISNGENKEVSFIIIK